MYNNVVLPKLEEVILKEENFMYTYTLQLQRTFSVER